MYPLILGLLRKKKTQHMKNHIYLLIILLVAQVQMHSQLSNENFIYTEAPQKPLTSANYSSLPASQKQKTVTYFDGLGRPMQTIAIGQGGNGEDIITPVTYDGFGRQDKDYLPYTAPSSGTHRTNALSDVLTFYDNTKYDADFPNMTTANINPYSQKQFEPPLPEVYTRKAAQISLTFRNFFNDFISPKFLKVLPTFC